MRLGDIMNKNDTVAWIGVQKSVPDKRILWSMSRSVSASWQLIVKVRTLDPAPSARGN